MFSLFISTLFYIYCYAKDLRATVFTNNLGPKSSLKLYKSVCMLTSTPGRLCMSTNRWRNFPMSISCNTSALKIDNIYVLKCVKKTKSRIAFATVYKSSKSRRGGTKNLWAPPFLVLIYKLSLIQCERPKLRTLMVPYFLKQQRCNISDFLQIAAVF